METNKSVRIIDLSSFYPAFYKSLLIQCQINTIDLDTMDAIVTRLMANIVELQRNSDTSHIEHYSRSSVLTLRDYGIVEMDLIMSCWLPMMLFFTGQFVKSGCHHIEGVWRLASNVNGQLTLTID